jgi:hypothetical protein
LLGRFDFDYLGTKVSDEATDEWTGEECSEF